MNRRRRRVRKGGITRPLSTAWAGSPRFPSPSRPERFLTELMREVVFPGPKSAAMIKDLRRHVIADPYPFVLDLAGGRGMWLATIDGQQIFDWAGYYASKWI